ncbi:hypothetical protein PoB_002738800 [Plakobranchus ocellatus]|uniref:Uncharacterized protein n=1 Tax=Plakobranchus ocellatus TaxID=259542 RepID=A0AAV4A2M4_9GAST|nr:hypothetical protein PoB_002738800 [Plakobranchus ocellatus]
MYWDPKKVQGGERISEHVISRRHSLNNGYGNRISKEERAAKCVTVGEFNSIPLLTDHSLVQYQHKEEEEEKEEEDVNDTLDKLAQQQKHWNYIPNRVINSYGYCNVLIFRFHKLAGISQKNKCDKC